MPAAPYVPLRILSCFTMLEGAMEPKAIASRAQTLGFPAVALADRNGLYAAMPFCAAAVEKGVQPIIGCQLDVAYADGAQPVAHLLPGLSEVHASINALVEHGCEHRHPAELHAPGCRCHSLP